MLGAKVWQKPKPLTSGEKAEITLYDSPMEATRPQEDLIQIQ
jgi:hypothetical protein